MELVLQVLCLPRLGLGVEGACYMVYKNLVLAFFTELVSHIVHAIKSNQITGYRVLAQF